MPFFLRTAQKKKRDCLLAVSRGAENEARTRDPNLGKVVLYQLSYFRISFKFFDNTLYFESVVKKIISLKKNALVKKMRLELTRPNGHYPLKVARLPIPPLLHSQLFQSAQHRVPRTGLEPARLSTLAPETSASTIPPPGLLLNTSVHALSDFERKTRLELATPTLARLCSTN